MRKFLSKYIIHKKYIKSKLLLTKHFGFGKILKYKKEKTWLEIGFNKGKEDAEI